MVHRGSTKIYVGHILYTIHIGTKIRRLAKYKHLIVCFNLTFFFSFPSKVAPKFDTDVEPFIIYIFLIDNSISYFTYPI